LRLHLACLSTAFSYLFIAPQAVFVRTWAESYALPFYTCELPQHMRQSVGFQERARTWRREESLRILQEWSQEVRGSPDPRGANIPSDRSEGAGASVHILPFYIATAHIHEDQLETLLLKLLRGVHIANIHGVSQPLPPGYLDITNPYSSHTPSALLHCTRWTLSMGTF
jgi:tRNA(Ile)-lysidine synthase TilS/MesJ